jgi:hypothetical protein
MPAVTNWTPASVTWFPPAAFFRYVIAANNVSHSVVDLNCLSCLGQMLKTVT